MQDHMENEWRKSPPLFVLYFSRDWKSWNKFYVHSFRKNVDWFLELERVYVHDDESHEDEFHTHNLPCFSNLCFKCFPLIDLFCSLHQ